MTKNTASGYNLYDAISSTFSIKKTNCFFEMMTSVAVLVFACTLVELSAKRKLAETLQQLKRKREQQVVTWRRSYFKEHRKEKKMREREIETREGCDRER